ncbi:hypothetical protein VE03_01198 [Pseudogymnoascus sp. 23342-1-I1]|nr:hypothetical protein VE03_01198 [Pseudogymnoascus sp. 23342-1-I1]
MESSQLREFSGTSHPASKSIPFDKYSSAVGREGAQRHRWVHDVRKDLLTVTFKPVDIPIDGGRNETHLFMAITAGRDTLEHLDVQKLVRWSQEHNERVRRGLVNRDVESPVQVIVRFPCIAMRFPGSPSMVQRFQLRFRDNKQYLEALNILKRAGLPIKDSALGPKQDATSQDRNVTYNRSMTPIPTPPLSVSHYDNHQRPQFTVPSSESSRKFTHFMDSSSIPPRSDTSSSLSMRPSSTFSEDLGGIRSSSSLGALYKNDIVSDDFCFQPPPPRPFSSVSLTRSSPLSYAPQIETQQQKATLTQGPWTETPSDRVELRKGQAHIEAPGLPLSNEETPGAWCNSLEKSSQPPEIIHPQRDSTKSPTSQQPQDGSKMRRSATTTQFAPSQNGGYNKEHLQLGRQSSLSFSTIRPMSAPAVGDDLRVSQWIPPKRELPFQKSKDPKKVLETTQKLNKVSENDTMLHSKSTGAPGNLINKTVLPNKHGEQQVKRAAVRRTNTPPTSKLSSVVEVPDSDEETQPVNAHRNSALWEEEPSPLASKSAAITRPSTPPGLKSKAIASRKRSNEATPKWALAKRVKMISSSTQTQTLSGRDHTAAMSRASTITAEPVLPAPVTALVTAPVTDPTPTVPVPGPAPDPSPPKVISEAKGPTEGFMDELGHFVAKYGGRRKPVEIWEVSGWDKATKEERHSMTETWLCDQLEDPSFMELCKRNWRGIVIISTARLREMARSFDQMLFIGDVTVMDAYRF